MLPPVTGHLLLCDNGVTRCHNLLHKVEVEVATPPTNQVTRVGWVFVLLVVMLLIIGIVYVYFSLVLSYYSRYRSSEAWICWWNPDLKQYASFLSVDLSLIFFILWLVGSRIARTA